MSSAVEAVVILLCVVAVVYLSADLLRGRMRERNEREILDRLAPDAPTTIITPVEPGLVERKLRAAGLKGPAEAYVFAVSLFAALVSVVLLRFLPALPLVALIGSPSPSICPGQRSTSGANTERATSSAC
jgi:hypothetical protein